MTFKNILNPFIFALRTKNYTFLGTSRLNNIEILCTIRVRYRPAIGTGVLGGSFICAWISNRSNFPTFFFWWSWLGIKSRTSNARKVRWVLYHRAISLMPTDSTLKKKCLLMLFSLILNNWLCSELVMDIRINDVLVLLRNFCQRYT